MDLPARACALLLSATLVAGAAVGPRPTPTPTPPAPAVPSNLPALQLFGPGDTEGTVQGLIDGARQRVLVEAYMLDDRAIVDALERARQRGVDVRVMLDPRGLNSKSTAEALARAGIRTHTPNPSYVTHLSMVVADNSAVAVMTEAPTTTSLGPTGHGYAVIDRDRMDVLQAASLFYDDWLRRAVRLFGHNLVVLPDSASAITQQIDGTGSRIELYTSGLSDGGVLSSLRAARGRGVVTRVLTQQSSNSAALRQAVPPGEVRFGADGGGTVLVLDRRTVLVGSMDLSSSTLQHNRELGVILGGQTVASLVDTPFFAAFARGRIIAPVVTPSKSERTVKFGRLAVTVTPPTLVRVGGEGVVAVSTAPGASIHVTIQYPSGGTAHPSSGSGHAGRKGSFIYRWIVPKGIKAGRALAVVVVQSGGYVVTNRQPFTVAQ